AVPGLERGPGHARVGADRQRLVIAWQATGQCDEAPGTLAARERLRAPRRGAAALLRKDPDLEDAGDARLLVVLGVADAAAGTHHLHIAGHGAATVALVVLVADRAFAHIGDDFHVRVRMRREAGAGSDGVVVPHPQRAPVHARRVLVPGEGEMVLGIEPTMIGSTEAGKRATFDHGGLLWTTELDDRSLGAPA